jgi:hypothetical protein
MKKIYQVMRLFFALIVCVAITGCARNSLPKLETVADWPVPKQLPDDVEHGMTWSIPWFPRDLPEGLEYSMLFRGWHSMAGDELQGIGWGQCSTDAAAIEAAKFWAIGGLVRGILLDEPDDFFLSFWPDMVYELTGSVNIKVQRLASRTITDRNGAGRFRLLFCKKIADFRGLFYILG